MCEAIMSNMTPSPPSTPPEANAAPEDSDNAHPEADTPIEADTPSEAQSHSETNRHSTKPIDTLSKIELIAIKKFRDAHDLPFSNNELFAYAGVNRRTGYRIFKEHETQSGPREETRGRPSALSSDQVDQLVAFLKAQGDEGCFLPWAQLCDAAGLVFPPDAKPVSGHTIKKYMHQRSWKKCLTCNKIWINQHITPEGKICKARRPGGRYCRECIHKNCSRKADKSHKDCSKAKAVDKTQVAIPSIPAHAHTAAIPTSHTHPNHTQPTHQTQSTHTQPTHTQQPMHTQPAHTQPAHTHPTYTQPSYTQPAHAHPTHTQTTYNTYTPYL